MIGPTAGIVRGGWGRWVGTGADLTKIFEITRRPDMGCHEATGPSCRVPHAVMAADSDGPIARTPPLPGGRLVKHSRYYWHLLAESHLTRRLFGSMLQRIWALPVPTG